MCYNRLMNKRYWATALAIPAVFGLFATSNALADNTTVTVNVTNISLELDVPSDPAVLTLRPTATGANFGSVDLTATVGTNNPAGYQLSVEFSDTSLIRTAAIGNDTPEINTLDDLSGGYAENDFTVNRWGQKVTGDNYFPVPSGTLAPASWSSDEPVNNADNIITLAAKADGTIPSGTYEVTLTYTLVANVVSGPVSLEQAYSNAGKTKTTVSGNQYYVMQDMTSEICSNTTEIPSELQVVDNRDNKIYWIAKLADNRCWMTQNLDLDLVHMENDEDALYTHENTDIGWESGSTTTSSWNPPYSTIPAASISNSGMITNLDQYCQDHTLCSLDVGDWYWTDTWYGSSDCPDDEGNNYAACNYLNGNANGKFSQTAYANNGTHGHVGNYYAGDAIFSYYDGYWGSICPAGWELPRIDINAWTSQPELNDYYNLFNEYVDNLDPSAYVSADTDIEITPSPLYFVRSGYYDFEYSNKLFQAGSAGSYWSNNGGMDLEHEDDQIVIFDAGGINLEIGSSVRCVAR